MVDASPGGPFFFAWVDAGTAFDPALHARDDADIFAFDLDHQEGDFATLALKVRNPRVGLLAPGRKVWAWFSWFDGAQVKPLFFGRLVGLPDQLQGETVQFNFIARPVDFAAQKIALAENMKVRPYWDSIWFAADTRDDPDNVLQSRPELWHTDRISHVVTASNIISGEDGTLSFSDEEVPYDTVVLNYSQNALRRVSMTATVSWDQVAAGSINLTGRLISLIGSRDIQSRTGEGLADDWPKPQQSLGGGWTWGDGTFCNVIGGVVNPSLVGESGYDPLTRLYYYLDGGIDVGIQEDGTYWPDGYIPPFREYGWAYHVAIPLITLQVGLSLDYDAKRRRTEILAFTLETDVQSILTEPDDQETLALQMASSELTVPIESGGAAPLDAKSRAYFSTERGAQSLEYLISVARAHLLVRARAVNMSFQIPFPLAVASELSCRKNAALSDPRLPGTTVAGKIIGYKLALADGAAMATVQIGCSVGRGGSVEAVAGAPDYVDEDYVGDDYQHYTGSLELPFPSDVAYEPLEAVVPNDDGIDFDRMTPDAVIINFDRGPDPATGTLSQLEALGLFDIRLENTGAVKSSDNREFDFFQLTLKPLTGGPFETGYAPLVTELKIPKTIDLEAAS